MRLISNLSGNQVQDSAPISVFPSVSASLFASPEERKVNVRDILAGGLSGISALASIGSANAAAGGLETQAAQAGFQAAQQSILAQQQSTLGAQQVTQLLQDFGAKRANLQVSLASAGISGGATVGASFNQLQEAEERAIAGAGFDTRTRVLNALQQEATLKQSASALRASAKTTRRAAKFGAFGELLSVGLRDLKRGKK